MTTILIGLAAAIALVAVLARLTTLLGRGKEPARLALWLGLAGLVLAMIDKLPLTDRWIDTLSGLHMHWPIHFLVVVSTVHILQVFFLYSVYGTDPDGARRRAGWLLLAVATVVIMLVPFIVNPAADDFAYSEDNRYRLGGPGELITKLALLSFAVYLTLAMLHLTYLAGRWAGKSGPGALRTGLRVLAAGCGLAGLVGLHSVGYYLVLLAGVVPPWPEARVAEAIVPFAVILEVVGILIPAVGPRLARVRRWAAHRRALTALYPLWAGMCAAAPELALDPVPPRWRDRLRVRELDYLLYRRVIEIWDVRRKLRDYVPPAVAAEEEAARIADGLRALRERRPPNPMPVPAPAGRGGDLAAEVAWWRTVAAAYRRSAA